MLAFPSVTIAVERNPSLIPLMFHTKTLQYDKGRLGVSESRIYALNSF